jgi:hypothetical protein
VRDYLAAEISTWSHQSEIGMEIVGGTQCTHQRELEVVENSYDGYHAQPRTRAT